MTETLQSSFLAQPKPSKKDLEHSPETASFAVGRSWNERSHPEKQQLSNAIQRTPKLQVNPVFCNRL